MVKIDFECPLCNEKNILVLMGDDNGEFNKKCKACEAPLEVSNKANKIEVKARFPKEIVKSLEDRYQDRFGDQLPESVATDSARKDYNEKKTSKPNIVFKPRSKLKLTPKKKTTPKDEEKPVPKIETKDKKVSRLGDKIGSGLKSSGSKTKSALGNAGSAVGRGAGAVKSGIGRGAGAVKSGIGRGAGAVKSGIGRGASSVMGLFGRGNSKEEKPKKGRKTTKDNADYSSMKLPELRTALKKKGLPTSGNKAALIKRLNK